MDAGKRGIYQKLSDTRFHAGLLNFGTNWDVKKWIYHPAFLGSC